MDEAGRGPLAGPVVASAVILFQLPPCSSLDDSKRLTPRARETAYRAILSSAAIGVGAAGVEEIDRIGIHAATHQAMIRALRKLSVPPDWVLVDGNHLPRGCPFPAEPVVDGDARSLSIACASIVAKVVRDQWMGLVHRLHPEYGFQRHKGYGTPEHLRALRWLGPCRFHRFSFQPIRAPFPLRQAQGERQLHSVRGDRHSVRGDRYSVRGDRYSVRGDRHSVRGDRHSVRGELVEPRTVELR